MADQRRKNVDWAVADLQGQMYSGIREGVLLAVLMDIRDELQSLNQLLHCQNFTDIPRRLAQIRSNTAKPRKKVA